MKFFKILSLFLICSMADAAIVNGVQNSEILNLIQSQLSDWKDISSDSISFEFKMKRDKRVIKEILASYGYFDAQITYERKQHNVVFDIKVNERYKFDDILLIYTDQKDYRSGLTVKQVFDLLDIGYDSYTDTKQLADGGDKIADFLRDKGFAFVKVRPPKMKVDREAKKIKVIYKIQLNGKTVIDKTIINIKSKKNSKRLEQFVKNRIGWRNGDFYDRKKIEDMKTALMESKMFAGILVSLSDPTLDKNDSTVAHTTITIDIEEALLREIAAGLKYGSSEKLGILFSWTNYNIDGKGTSIATLVDVAKKNRNVKFKHEVPDLFYKKQRLSSQVFYAKEDAKSYDVTKVGAESILWQTVGSKFHIGGGLSVEESETKDKLNNNDEMDFSALGIPVGFGFDTTEEFLDPQKGIRCRVMVTPYIGNITDLTVLSGRAALYFPFKKNEFKNSIIFALYTKYGTIFRNKSEKIPRDKLFFAGGANSVRGYGYHKLGPIDANRKPIGGESVFEFGVEPRFRVSDNIGIVAFFEGGNVYKTKMPNPLKELLFGYGVGMRYYTPFGPIRLDIAFPCKIRKTKADKNYPNAIPGKKIDSRFNLYISIGQAF